MRIQKKFHGTIPKNKILDMYSDSQTDTYSCNKINELIGTGGGTGGSVNIDLSSAIETIYEGMLLGEESIQLENHKRFLDVYFVVHLTNHRMFSKYTIDTTLTEPSFGGTTFPASDGSTGLSHYMSEAKWESTTKTLTHFRTGYFNVESAEFFDRNGKENYYIYRIDTYDNPLLSAGNSGTGGGSIDLSEIEQKPKSIMTLKLDADITCVTGAYTHLPLTVYSKEGEGLIYENGYVKVGSGIHKVKVSGCAKFGTNGTSTKHIHIDKNSTTIAWAMEIPASASLGASPKITPIVVDVKEGDLIDLKYYTSTTGDIVEGHGTCFTYLTVEAVEEGQNVTMYLQAGETTELVTNNIFKAKLSAVKSIDISSAWTRVIVPFDVKETGIGENLSLTSDGTIKIGAGINKISVQGHLLATPTTIGTIEAQIRVKRDGTVISATGFYVHLDKVNDYRSVIMSNPLIEVQENDEVYITATSDTVNTFTFAKDGYLTVENITETIAINSGSDLTIDKIYPVGSIYMSINNTDPKDLFGGEWEQIKDTFLLSAGDTYTAGTTGGEAEHTLTVDEMPNHKHNVWELPIVDTYGYGNSADGYSLPSMSTKTAPKIVTGTAGNDQPHNNMPPYLAVYMWKRIG